MSIVENGSSKFPWEACPFEHHVVHKSCRELFSRCPACTQCLLFCLGSIYHTSIFPQIFIQSYVVDLCETLHSPTPLEEIPVNALTPAFICIPVHQE